MLRAGHGTVVLQVLADNVSTEVPEVIRVEGQPRDNDVAMRKTSVPAVVVTQARCH